MELTADEYSELEIKVANILHGNYSKSDKHVMSVRLYYSKLLNKFLTSIKYDSIAKKNSELITLVLDCLEY